MSGLIERAVAALETIATALSAGANLTNAAAAAPAKTAATTEKKSEKKPEKKTEAASSVTAEQMQAAVLAVKDKFGMPEAKAILKQYGHVEKMAEVATKDLEAVYNAAKAKCEGEEELEEAGSDI